MWNFITAELKKYSRTIIFISFFSFEGLTQQIDTTYYPNGRINEIIPFNHAGIKHGMYLKFSEVDDTLIQVKGRYKNGLKEGIWNEYDSMFTYVSNVRNGPFKIYGVNGFYQNGLIEGDVLIGDPGFLEELRRYRSGVWVWQEIYFNIWASKLNMHDIRKGPIKNGKRHGIWNTYNESGVLKSSYNYNMGKLSGIKTMYFPNKQIKATWNFVDDIINGEVNFYSPNGKIIGKAYYSGNNDRPEEGTYIEYYDEDGWKATHFEDGTVVKEESFDMNGMLTGLVEYEEGKESVIQYFDKNGQITFEEKRHGHYDIWKKQIDPQTIDVGRTANSEERTKLYEYYEWTFRAPYARYANIPDVQLRFEKGKLVFAYYDGIELNIKETSNDQYELVAFHNNGEVAANGTANGHQTGIWNNYYNNGKLHTSVEFNDGVPNGLFLNYDTAGGAEFALESAEWNNGLFTYCLLEGLKTNNADLNSDGEIMVSELKKYVSEKVTQLSGGRQQPTSRIENISMDYRVW